MSQKILSVIARIKAIPGKEKALESALRDLLEPTRLEEGCINYDLHVNADDSGEFFFYENWRSEADLIRHLESDHIRKLRQRAPELLAQETEIVRCWRVG